MKKLMAVMLLGLSFGAGAETLLSLERTRSINLNTNDPSFGIDDPLTSGSKTYESSCVLDSKGAVTLVTKFGKLSTLTKKTTFKIDVPLIRSVIDGSKLIPNYSVGDALQNSESYASPYGATSTKIVKVYQNGKARKSNGFRDFSGTKITTDHYHKELPMDAVYYSNGVESFYDSYYHDLAPKGSLEFVMGVDNTAYLKNFMEEICK